MMSLGIVVGLFNPLHAEFLGNDKYVLLYPLYPKDRGMLWFYVEAARRPPPAMVLTR